jgi:hypothetical protein
VHLVGFIIRKGDTVVNEITLGRSFKPHQSLDFDDELEVTLHMLTCFLSLKQRWRTQEFFLGVGSTNSVEDRENGDLGAVVL